MDGNVYLFGGISKIVQIYDVTKGLETHLIKKELELLNKIADSLDVQRLFIDHMNLLNSIDFM